jgi:hypothetical protein
VRVMTPNADSIELRSSDGLDRYAVVGPVLNASLPSDFGNSGSQTQFAVRARGRLFNVLKKPLNIVVCRRRACQSYYHELPVLLPERNHRRFVISGGWNNAFSMRMLQRAGLATFQRARGRSEWDLQAELSTWSVNARIRAYAGADQRGGSLDISRGIKQSPGEFNYGIAMHLGVAQAEWPGTIGGTAFSGGAAYRASIGPAIMLQGITASSQLGIYTDGKEVMQELSTFLSINGGLTEVRMPLTITVDKTYAFGDESLYTRRREELERLTIGWNILPSLALRMKIATRRSSWPIEHGQSDLYATQTDFSLGAQLSTGW